MTKVLLFIEELGRRSFMPEDLLDLADELDLDANDLIQCKTSLYTLLMSFTTGNAKKSARRGKAKGVF